MQTFSIGFPVTFPPICCPQTLRAIIGNYEAVNWSTVSANEGWPTLTGHRESDWHFLVNTESKLASSKHLGTRNKLHLFEYTGQSARSFILSTKVQHAKLTNCRYTVHPSLGLYLSKSRAYGILCGQWSETRKPALSVCGQHIPRHPGQQRWLAVRRDGHHRDVCMHGPTTWRSTDRNQRN